MFRQLQDGIKSRVRLDQMHDSLMSMILFVSEMLNSDFIGMKITAGVCVCAAQGSTLSLYFSLLPHSVPATIFYPALLLI